MTKVDVLDRVAADLSSGRTHLAIQRLSSLVAAHPADLDLRRRLGEAHRCAGNLAEAGRWGYLDPSSDPAEAAAFERRYPDPAVRLDQLRWPLTSEAAATEFARDRLATLAAARGAATRPGRRGPAHLALMLIVAALAASLAALGAITVVQWVAG